MSSIQNTPSSPSMRPIALVGLPGSGKSTIGKHLARKFGLEFCDSDSAIEKSEGVSIRDIFETKGELAFREIESATLERLTRRFSCVISTGGGAILSEANREILASRCDCVYLRATPEDLFKRLKNDRKRPLLQVENPSNVLRELFKVRDPLYRSVATCTVDTGLPSIHALVQTISSKLQLIRIEAAEPARGSQS